MLSLDKNLGVLGAGEPPHNGVIYGFQLQEKPKILTYNCVVHSSNANIESSSFDVCVEVNNVEESIVEAQIDGASFYLSDSIKGEQITSSTFVFRIALPNIMSPGDFVVPLSLTLKSGHIVTRPIAIKLTRRHPLPSRLHLQQIPTIVQEKPTYSGAAIASAIKKANGVENVSSQKEIREMIDAVRNLSGYEPFQTWRIILRRVLTSQAQNYHELPEFSPKKLEKKVRPILQHE